MSYICTMKSTKPLSISDYSLNEFKQWFKVNYSIVIGKYYIGNKRYDWQSIVNDSRNNGVLKIFKHERNLSAGLD